MATITSREEFEEYCLKNKYSKWYFSIIDKAIARGWNKKTAPVYTESHHIIPSSIIKNKVTVHLTAREHFVCHLLLAKMFVGENKHKMIYACISMGMKSSRTSNRYINSNLYNTVRTQYAEIKKELWKNDEYREFMVKRITETHWDSSKEKNPMYGKKGILSPHYGKTKTKEHKEKIKKALTGMKYSKERRQNMSLNCPKNSLGKKWYHNPITQTTKYFFEGQQPQGFVLGRG
jgi:hypothetical protein